MKRSTTTALAAAGAAALWYLRRRRANARRRARLLEAGHEQIDLLPNERGAVICMSPAISTVTFCRGSLERAAAKLGPRVAAVVRANPWLAARLDDCDGELALFVPPNARDAKRFAVRYDVALRRKTPYVALVEALARGGRQGPVLCGTSNEARGTSAPLWQVSLVPCADDANAYALVVSANHSLLDGIGPRRNHNAPG